MTAEQSGPKVLSGPCSRRSGHSPDEYLFFELGAAYFNSFFLEDDIS
jgi:hypothetical protein